MNKCPRCKNEKIREGQNFCQICGLRLEELSKKQVIECLEKLKDQYECIYGDEFTFEISCLEYAINELERTAQEVPVQEQLQGSITTQVGNTREVISKDGIIITVR